MATTGQQTDPQLEAEMQRVRETYERDLDAKYAAARGFVDAVIAPIGGGGLLGGGSKCHFRHRFNRSCWDAQLR